MGVFLERGPQRSQPIGVKPQWGEESTCEEISLPKLELAVHLNEMWKTDTCKGDRHVDPGGRILVKSTKQDGASKGLELTHSRSGCKRCSVV